MGMLPTIVVSKNRLLVKEFACFPIASSLLSSFLSNRLAFYLNASVYVIQLVEVRSSTSLIPSSPQAAWIAQAVRLMRNPAF